MIWHNLSEDLKNYSHKHKIMCKTKKKKMKLELIQMILAFPPKSATMRWRWHGAVKGC